MSKPCLLAKNVLIETKCKKEIITKRCSKRESKRTKDPPKGANEQTRQGKMRIPTSESLQWRSFPYSVKSTICMVLETEVRKSCENLWILHMSIGPSSTVFTI